MLYGPSGVGKSSLLRAAVARSLRELPEEPLVLVFARWSDDPAAALAAAVGAATGADNGSALECSSGTVGSGRLSHPRPDRGVLPLPRGRRWARFVRGSASGAADAPSASTCSSRSARTRSPSSTDSPAGLPASSQTRSGWTGSTARPNALRSSARSSAMRSSPAPRSRSSRSSSNASSTRPGRADRAGSRGLGADRGLRRRARIEAPYLQLVMQRLWEEERAAGSDVLRAETLDRLGGAERIVEDHLQGAMDELTGAARRRCPALQPPRYALRHEDRARRVRPR